MVYKISISIQFVVLSVSTQEDMKERIWVVTNSYMVHFRQNSTLYVLHCTGTVQENNIWYLMDIHVFIFHISSENFISMLGQLFTNNITKIYYCVTLRKSIRVYVYI